MTAIKMTLRFTAAVLVLVLILAAIPGAVFATESARPATTGPDETQPPVTESPEEPLPRAGGTTVTMKGDRIRQIQWIGQSEGRVDIRYTDALGNTHSGWITAITAYKADGVYAYCIEPSVEMASEYTDNAAAKAWAQQLTEGQRAAIAAALAVGYPSRDFPAADPPGVAGASFLEYPLRTDLWQISERYAATQIIIWEIVLGKRSAEPPYACTDKSLFESFYRARGKNPYGNRSDWETLKLTYDTISQSMADLSTIPSFTGKSESDAPVYDLIFDEEAGYYTITLTDENSILSQYDFTVEMEGVTVTASENELTITVAPEAVAMLGGTFLLSAEGTALEVDPDTVVAVWAPNGTGQTAVSLKADPIPVTA